MEAAGFAVGIAGLAGLFSACLEAVNRAQSYRSFASDAKALDLQFTATQVRLEHWGRAVGILDLAQADDGADSAPRHHPALDDAHNQKTALQIFEFVKEMCESAGAGKLRLGTVDLSKPPDLLIEPGDSSRRKFAWAMGGKLRRTEQVELFKELVQILHNMAPPDDYEAGAPVANAWSSGLSQIISRLEAQARREVHAWLRHVPGERYRDSLQRRLEGTCLWILREERFLMWKSPVFASNAKILWVHGPAGFGKTILCANMIQHLTTELGTPTAHFFFSSEAGSRNDPFLAVRSWVSQVISSNDGAYRLALQRQEKDNDPSATRHTIMAIFEDLVRLIPGCTFVLDGLDECTIIDGGAQNSAVTFLGAVMNAIAGTETRLLVVSRFLAGIQHALQGAHPSKLSEIKLRPNDVQADIVAYSRDVVDKKLKNKNAALRSSISDTIAERCKGQFLWIRLQGESLRRGMSKKQLEETVKDTPTDLDNIYDHNWTTITQLKDADKNRAFAILRWAAFSERPLAINELAEAILVDESHKCDIEDLCDPIDNDYVETEILGLCGSLIEVNTEEFPSVPSHWTLHLPHFTVREFLAGRLPTPGWIASSDLQPSPEMIHHTLLAEVCFRYISLPEIWTLPLTPDCYVAGTSFRNYATDAFHRHAILGVSSNPTWMELAMQFFTMDNPSWVAWRTLKVAIEAQQAGENSTEAAPPLMRPIHYALHLGMLDFAASLLKFRALEPEDLDATVESAFRSACRSGLTSVLKAMIDQGADVSSIGDDGWSPLHLVAYNGRVDAARLLLSNNADARVVSKAGSPLHQSVLSGSVEMVKLLLENHAASTINNIVSYEGFDLTPLHAACVEVDIEIVRLLLSYGADPSIVSSTGADAINLAAVSGSMDLVYLLMDHNTERKGVFDESGMPHLDAAAAGGNLDLVVSLLEMGADANALSGPFGHSPLQEAVASGHEKVAEVLIRHGAIIDTDDERPLSLAAHEGHLNIIKLLLDATTTPLALINGSDSLGRSSLFYASRAGHLSVVRFLLEAGAEQHVTDWRGWNPLSAAVQCGHSRVASFLRDFEAGPDERKNQLLDEDALNALVEKGENPDPNPGFCDACLLDNTLGDGQNCNLCSALGFYLCTECYNANTGCPDPTHEFWPTKDIQVEATEPGEVLS